MAKKATKVIQTSGSRKTAIARLTMSPGTGKVTVNKTPLENYEPKMARLKIKEVLMFGQGIVEKQDIAISINGGGVTSQADAARLAVGKALVESDDKLREKIIQYDRQMLVADVRVKEAAKPNSHGKARAKRQKSYR